jgi:hypothetical protein
MKRTIPVALVLCFAVVAIGYAEGYSEELALNMAAFKVDTEAKRAMTTAIEVFRSVNSEEEMPCFPNVTSEQEIPRWNLSL